MSYLSLVVGSTLLGFFSLLYATFNSQTRHRVTADEKQVEVTSDVETLLRAHLTRRIVPFLSGLRSPPFGSGRTACTNYLTSFWNTETAVADYTMTLMDQTTPDPAEAQFSSSPASLASLIRCRTYPPFTQSLLSSNRMSFCLKITGPATQTFSTPIFAEIALLLRDEGTDELRTCSWLPPPSRKAQTMIYYTFHWGISSGSSTRLEEKSLRGVLSVSL